MKKLERWHVILGMVVIGIAIAVPVWGAMDWRLPPWAPVALVEQIATDQKKNTEADFRLRQAIINNTRNDRQERKLQPNPRWLQEQEDRLNRERCFHRQRYDKKVVCDK